MLWLLGMPCIPLMKQLELRYPVRFQMWQILWQIYFGSAPSYVATLDLAMGLIDNEYTSGSNSAVEFLPSKQAVAGSNPVSRSN